MHPKQFTGLGMPVFTAFGWAGEENATKFALAQLELFIHALRMSLHREAQSILTHSGLDEAAKAVYLGAGEEVEREPYFVFHARPTSLEIILAITDKKALARALKTAEAVPELWHRYVTELGPEWTLRIQQMQYDPETEESTHYQDIFKDTVDHMNPETAANVAAKANFHNSEGNWITPIYLSRRFDAEPIALMGYAVLDMMVEQINLLMPLYRFLSGQRGKGAAKGRARARTAVREKKVVEPAEPEIDPIEQFTYVSELKSLHIQRGFINLTSLHWPFFALNARTETRRVTVYYDGRYDRKSAVWRLVPDDQARIVLSPAVQEWIEDHFNPDDTIKVTAKKLDEKEIQIDLAHVEE
jgi:hypothetical protein